MTTSANTPAEASKSHGKKIVVAAMLVALAAAATAATLHFVDTNGESTQDAYVDGNIVQVTPQLSGSVVAINADNTDYVQAGQVLVQFNDVDTKLALGRAQAQLAHVVRQVRAQFSNAMQAGANVTLRESDLAKVEADLARRRQLISSGAVSGEDVTHAEDAVKAARAALVVAREQQNSARSLVDKTDLANHPDVQAAISQLRDAYLANARTVVRAPVSGVVSKRNVQLGQRVSPASPLMSIVPSGQMWVNANFKESQLRHVRVGQPVVLTADVYGKDVSYHGTVVGQDAGTGSAFSLLPAQNASGNWIKVVQRVPVRVAIAPAELAAHPLKLGLSMQVSVDTTRRSAEVPVTSQKNRTHYSTDVFSTELAQVDELVQKVIADNTITGQHTVQLAKGN